MITYIHKGHTLRNTFHQRHASLCVEDTINEGNTYLQCNYAYLETAQAFDRARYKIAFPISRDYILRLIRGLKYR